MTDINNRNDKPVPESWQSLDQRDPERWRSAAAGDSAPETGVGRREFLLAAGFTVGATALAGCSRGREHGVIPYLVRPEEVTPGRPYWYATVCGACPAGCGLLAKGRDGRPIKLEGNPGHPVSAGGLCAVGQGSVLALYDSKRRRQPFHDGRPTTWEEVDRDIGAALDRIAATGGRVRFLTDSCTGPAERWQIGAFLDRFADGRHVTYDPVSIAAIASAHGDTHGAAVLPRYRFDRAAVIVSLDADFLGGWISPVEHTRGYRAGRRLEEAGSEFSWHLQFESRLSLTGSNADRRVPAPPGSAAAILAHLAVDLAGRSGAAPPAGTPPPLPVGPEEVQQAADRLWRAPRGRALVICGDNDIAAQRLVNFIHHLLGSTAAGGTVDIAAVSHQRRGDDAALAGLVEEIDSGRVDALFVRGGNPVYDLPGGDRLAAAMERIGLTVSFAADGDETARQARFVCPEPHFLESWGDSEPVDGVVALRQPALRAIGSSRPLLESLAAWSNRPAAARDLLRASWRRHVYPRRRSDVSFDAFWNTALHDGYVGVDSDPATARPVSGRFRADAVRAPSGAAGADAMRLDLHPSATVHDGRHAINPWLQELPDPVAKTVWDNFAALSTAAATRLGVETGDVIRIVATDDPAAAIEIPALVQPGQHDAAVAIALGYGRAGTERFTAVGPRWWFGQPTVEAGRPVGVNAAPLLSAGTARRYAGRPVRIEPTGRRHQLARTQAHHRLEVPAHLAAGGDPRRPIVEETTLAAWRHDPAAGARPHHRLASLWKDHPKSPHHWGLSIDLTACTGCSACVIACQAENNVAVVGRDEVRRAREMHWIRIDRYYSGSEQRPEVVHMPMMCQHCDNAPCETVCPVQATAQSAEGLNQQIYNRCVGTRYCANNCPYKVRRFNWFEYRRDDRLQNLALNPDVTVRSRGVMEKCSMCVQRIQDAKAEAKRSGRPLRDGDIRPACAQSCPADAIVFGDRNDPGSSLTRSKRDPRHFVVLEETGVRPVVGYLRQVRNRPDTG